MKALVLALALVSQALAKEPAIDSQYSPLPEKQIKCLVKNAFYEANGEGRLGRLLVTQVVFNRTTKDKDFCSTIYKEKQFSWTASKVKRIPWSDYLKIKSEVLELYFEFTHVPKHLRKATHFHTTSTKPYWSKSLVKVGVWKNHVFYAA
jgi:spore germination cell wall hydrolase CwlJ-like protein